jgi:cell division protein FtsQ
VLEAPRTTEAPGRSGGSRSAGPRSAAPRRDSGRAPGEPRLRRDLSDDYARGPASRVAAEETPGTYVPRRRFGIRFRLRGGMPRSVVGRAAAGAAFLAGMGLLTAVLWSARALLLHDPRLLIASSSAIQTTGNSHLSRAQMLSVFGEDVDRNILLMPLAERREELENLPWVEHATVMRLLPNHVRVAVVERTPVAFVREGSHIGLVDANGVLLEMSPDLPSDQHYSFPVITGISEDEALSTRAARMALFRRFTQELDTGGGDISSSLSEVDLSSPEDVQALIPANTGAGKSDILVHFGQTDFLARYLRFQRNIAEWKAGNPNLQAVDMRYDGEAVLEMRNGTSVAPNVAPTDQPAPAAGTAAKATNAGRTFVKSSATTRAKLAGKEQSGREQAAKHSGVAKAAPHPAAAVPALHHLEQAFDVHPKAHSTQAAPQ